MRFLRAVIKKVIRNDQGAPVRFVEGATQDITEQVEAQELLLESEAHPTEECARLAHVGHWQWDNQTNRIIGSDEMFRIFGKAPDYTPNFDDFLHTVIPEDKERSSPGG